MLSSRVFVTFVFWIALIGCRDQAARTATEPSSISAADAPDTWPGRWNGPEGTYLQISKTDSKFLLEIRDLDGSKSYAGSKDGSRLAFTRDGQPEYLSAGDGRATGMKWFAEKKNCLFTRAGEGWCRD